MNPIDRFLESERAKKGLIAAPRADRRTLIRRAYLDLIGLPPSPAQVRAFLDDKSPDAWTRVIDRCWRRRTMASAGGGTGSMWRATPTPTGSSRTSTGRTPGAIATTSSPSFNQDKPYNQFLKEQIAGDEMDGKSNETLIATGFLRAGPRVNFREKDNPERRWDYVDDLISTVSRGMLGLTVNCARCHNHKFDPIAQKDYYSLAAALNTWVEISVPLAPAEQAAEYAKANKEIDAKIAPLRKQIAAIERPYRERLKNEYIKKEFPENVQRAVFKPEAERTPGEQLLATQVLTGGGVTAAQVDKAMTPEELAQKKELLSADCRAREAAARAARHGGDRHRRRFPVCPERQRRRDDRVSEMPHSSHGPAQRHVPS